MTKQISPSITITAVEEVTDELIDAEIYLRGGFMMTMNRYDTFFYLAIISAVIG